MAFLPLQGNYSSGIPALSSPSPGGNESEGLGKGPSCRYEPLTDCASTAMALARQQTAVYRREAARLSPPTTGVSGRDGATSPHTPESMELVSSVHRLQGLQPLELRLTHFLARPTLMRFLPYLS